VPTQIRRYVRSLGLDAYIVGGAVRDELLGIDHADEDFLVPGVDHAGLRAALERLPENDRDLSMLALELGFSSHSHFTASFTREFGVPPSALKDGRRIRALLDAA